MQGTPTASEGTKLGFASKFFYGAGDIFGGGAMVVVGVFFLFFMTEVAHLDPALAGLVLLIGKIWDAVNDPLMGYLSDRTRSRFGRRRVYFLAGIVPIVLTFTLLWTVPPTSSQWALFAYFVVLSILFDSVLTMVMVPYSALIQEMTLDYNERSALTGWRMAFSNFSSLVSAAVPMFIVSSFADVTTGYRMMGLVFGLFFALPWVGVFAFTRERYQGEPPAAGHSSVGPGSVPLGRGFTLLTDARDALANRSFRMLIGVYLLTFLAMDVISAVMMYFMTYVVCRPNDVSLVLGLLLLFQLAALPLFVRIAGRWGKRVAFFGGAALWFLSLPWLFAVGPATPPWLLYLLAALLGVATSGAAFAPWAMFPDVLDVDEAVTGRRRQGVYSGVMTFLRKVSTAVAVFVVGWVIDASGYVPGVAASAAFVTAVRVLVALAPLLAVAVAMWFAWRFPITPTLHAVVREELTGSAGGTPVSAALYGPGSLPQGRGVTPR
ncbi:MAG: MFS transporter [Firmicutes bacterium]|nr:MFS transporter [Bacillota bacterium]